MFSLSTKITKTKLDENRHMNKNYNDTKPNY